jgi:hypothetical protein
MNVFQFWTLPTWPLCGMNSLFLWFSRWTTKFIVVGPLVVPKWWECHNPNLGLASKARACKVTGQEGSPIVTFHCLGSVGECEGMNLHTPKWAPILGVGVLMDSQIFKEQLQGSKTIAMKSSLYHWKFLYRSYLKWACMTHLDNGLNHNNTWPKYKYIMCITQRLWSSMNYYDSVKRHRPWVKRHQYFNMIYFCSHLINFEYILFPTFVSRVFLYYLSKPNTCDYRWLFFYSFKSNGNYFHDDEAY